MDQLHGLPVEKLLELCLGPNATQEAWTELVGRIQKIIRVTIYRSLKRWISPTRDRIDEVSQNTLEKIWSNDQRILRRFEFRCDKAFDRYMRLVASSVAEDYRRREMRDPVEQIAEDADFPDKASFPDGKILLEKFYNFLRLRYSEVECDIFWCHHNLGISGREISEMLKMRTKKVEYVLWTLMRALRDEFGDKYQD